MLARASQPSAIAATIAFMVPCFTGIQNGSESQSAAPLSGSDGGLREGRPARAGTGIRRAWERGRRFSKGSSGEFLHRIEHERKTARRMTGYLIPNTHIRKLPSTSCRADRSASSPGRARSGKMPSLMVSSN